MTREEAITALGDRNNLLWGMSKEEQKYYSEALDMAISALSAIENIKAEIDDEWANTHHMYPDYASGLARASEIINKHISGKETDEL